MLARLIRDDSTARGYARERRYDMKLQAEGSTGTSSVTTRYFECALRDAEVIVYYTACR